MGTQKTGEEVGGDQHGAKSLRWPMTRFRDRKKRVATGFSALQQCTKKNGHTNGTLSITEN